MLDSYIKDQCNLQCIVNISTIHYGVAKAIYVMFAHNIICHTFQSGYVIYICAQLVGSHVQQYNQQVHVAYMQQIFLLLQGPINTVS